MYGLSWNQAQCPDHTEAQLATSSGPGLKAKTVTRGKNYKESSCPELIVNLNLNFESFLSSCASRRSLLQNSQQKKTVKL